MSDTLDRQLDELGSRVQDRCARTAGDLGDVYRRRRRHDQRRRTVVLVGIALVAVAGSGALVTARHSRLDSQQVNLGGTAPSVTAATSTPSPTATAPVTSEPGRGPATVTTPTTSPAPAPGPAAPPSGTAGLQLLYPFASEGEARAWQADAGGHQPWHLSAEETALSFTTFLELSGIDRSLGTTTDDRGAHVTVGFSNPNGDPVRVAVVHLVRLGTGADAPWEVVGTDDALGLTLDSPRYGSVAVSPVAVGGRITGVDESVSVRAYQLGQSRPIGETPGVPAGGDNAPWSSTVSLAPRQGGTVTIVAITGGHLAAVERFAVTGVQVRG